MNSKFVYPLYGLFLESDLPLFDWEKSVRKEKEGRRRIFLRNQPLPPFRYEKFGFISGGIQYGVSSNFRFVCISSPRAGKFGVDLSKKSIYWESLSTKSLGLAQALVTGRILGLLIPHLDPTFVLHGCVLVVKGGAVGLLGPKGMGKSTLAANFLKRGFPLLSDDLVVVQKNTNEWIVHPGPPEIRLWPDTVKILTKQGMTLESLYPETTKKRILLNAKNPLFSWNRPVPLKALFLLSRKSKGNISAELLRAKEAFLQALRARYNQLPERPKILKQQFVLAAELIQNVPLYHLFYPSGLCYLDHIVDTILQQTYC